MFCLGHFGPALFLYPTKIFNGNGVRSLRSPCYCQPMRLIVGTPLLENLSYFIILLPKQTKVIDHFLKSQ